MKFLLAEHFMGVILLHLGVPQNPWNKKKLPEEFQLRNTDNNKAEMITGVVLINKIRTP